MYDYNSDLYMSMLDNAVTVAVKFNDGGKTYIYKALKSANIQVGDKVVVDSPHDSLTVVTVVGVDSFVNYDPNAGFIYKWIVDKIDVQQYQDLLAKDAEFFELVKKFTIERRKSELKAQVVEHLGEDSYTSLYTALNKSE